jgi:predicted RNase H-like HicB family nuclease
MEQAMNYPVVIHKDKNSDYGVTVPGLPGCFSAGSTIDEAVAMAREAIELHLEGLIEDGQPVPEPGRIEDYRTRRPYRGGTWAVVSVDPADLRVKAKRVNITMPERILGAVDRFAEAESETRSGLLVKAATEYMARAASRSGRASGRSRSGGGRRAPKRRGR